MSNTERQRRFRERNPGYYGRLHRRRKAEQATRFAAHQAALAATAAAEQIAEPVAEVVKIPLALPAPEMAFNYEALHAVETWPRVEEREAAMIERAA